MTDSFSKRQGFRQVHETPITVRDDAPYELRGVVVQLAYECGFRPRTLRPLVCRVLRKRQDDNNWSEYPNIDGEVTSLVDDCEWYRFYDVVEAIATEMHETPFSFEPEKFATEMNDYFLENGIGWKLVNAKLEVRGTVLFEQILRQAELELGLKVTWTPKTDPALMRASLSARLGQEKPHETQAPQPRAGHPQAENC